MIMNTDLNYYENEIKAINQELKALPDCYLVKHGSHYYVKKGNFQKGITKDRNKIRQLARKEYLLKRLRNLEWNSSILKKHYKRFRTEEPMEIIRGLSSVYQTLPLSYFLHPSVKDYMETIQEGNAAVHIDAEGKVVIIKGVRRNAAAGNALKEKTSAANGNALNEKTNAAAGNALQEKTNAAAGNALKERPAEGNSPDVNLSDKKKFHQDGLIYLTNSGLRVRSKSERTIADMLDKSGVPYYYEAELAFGREIWRPDFTIIRPHDGNVLLWEHLGLMNKEEYRMSTNKKLALYNRYGFYPFENLICTYEKDLKDPAYIQIIVDSLILR